VQFSRIRLSDHLHFKAFEFSLLALRYSPRWRSRILGVSSLTAITSPTLFKRLNESRAPSLRRHYPVSSVLLAPPTSHSPDSIFGLPYIEPSRPSPATNEISRVTRINFPHIPSRRPRRAHLLLFGSLADGSGLAHLTTGSALSIKVTRLYGFPGGTACEFAIPPLRKFSRSTLS